MQGKHSLFDREKEKKKQKKKERNTSAEMIMKFAFHEAILPDGACAA